MSKVKTNTTKADAAAAAPAANVTTAPQGEEQQGAVVANDSASAVGITQDAPKDVAAQAEQSIAAKGAAGAASQDVAAGVSSQATAEVNSPTDHAKAPSDTSADAPGVLGAGAQAPVAPAEQLYEFAVLSPLDFDGTRYPIGSLVQLNEHWARLLLQSKTIAVMGSY